MAARVEKNAILGIFIKEKHVFAAVMREHDGPGWDFDPLDFDGSQIRNYGRSSNEHDNFGKASYALFLPISEKAACDLLIEYEQIKLLREQGNTPYYFDENLAANPRFERKGQAPLDFHWKPKPLDDPSEVDTYEREGNAPPRVATNCEDWLFRTVQAHTGIDVDALLPRRGERPKNAFESVKSLYDGAFDMLREAKEDGSLQEFDHKARCGKLLEIAPDTYGYFIKKGKAQHIAGESGLNFFLDHVPEQRVGRANYSIEDVLQKVSLPLSQEMKEVQTPVTRTLELNPDPKVTNAKPAGRIDITPSEGVGAPRTWG